MINFCTLYSGSSGNCIFVGDENTKILVDAGKSGKDIESALSSIGQDIRDIDAIVVTHEHSDHIRGVGILSRKYNIPVYANKDTWSAINKSLGKMDEENTRVFTTNKEFLIDNIGVKAFDIPHDAAEPVGYTFFIGNKKVSVATDIGHVNETIFENLKASDILLLESNHDVEMVKVSRYPYYLKQRILGEHGHLSNENAGNFLTRLVNSGVNKVLLGHLSRENNFPELAYSSVKGILEMHDMKIGRDLKLEVALRDKCSNMYVL